MTPTVHASVQRIPALGLASFISGLLFAPWAYVAIGALGGFSAAFALLSLPLLSCSTAVLAARLLRQATPPWAVSRKGFILEIIAWLLLAFFLSIVSSFTLLTPLERVGFFCALWLICSLVSLGLLMTVLRYAALLRRVAGWPNQLVTPLSALASIGTAALAAAYALSVPRFL